MKLNEPPKKQKLGSPNYWQHADHAKLYSHLLQVLNRKFLIAVGFLQRGPQFFPSAASSRGTKINQSNNSISRSVNQSTTETIHLSWRCKLGQWSSSSQPLNQLNQSTNKTIDLSWRWKLAQWWTCSQSLNQLNQTINQPIKQSIYRDDANLANDQRAVNRSIYSVNQPIKQSIYHDVAN